MASAGPVAAASYTLVGGIILLGGIGYAVDRWWGTAPWGWSSGWRSGIVVGFYELIQTAWPGRRRSETEGGWRDDAAGVDDRRSARGRGWC